MKKTLIFLGLLLSTLPSFSQCSFYKNEVDEFTHNKVRITDYFTVSPGYGQSYKFSITQVNDNYFLNMFYSTLGTISMVIGEGDKLMLKLADESIITLQSVELKTATHSFTGSTSSSMIFCSYSISEEQLKTLSEKPVQKIRFYMTDGYYEKETNRRGADRLMTYVQCILN